MRKIRPLQAHPPSASWPGPDSPKSAKTLIRGLLADLVIDVVKGDYRLVKTDHVANGKLYSGGPQAAWYSPRPWRCFTVMNRRSIKCRYRR